MGASTFLARQTVFAAPDAHALDTFMARYMKVMNAPGMTLALARRQGTARIAHALNAALGYRPAKSLTGHCKAVSG